ncbi:MAG: hypothetical protein KAV87_56515 [Desulfobacteraceae bacterium]|nr:hypothetical protein [Desulfobacteraceae bacterium]
MSRKIPTQAIRRYIMLIYLVVGAAASCSNSNSEVENLRTEIEGLRAEVAKFKAGGSRTDGVGAKAIRGRFVSGGSLVKTITFDPDAMVATLESPLFLMTSGKMAYSYKATPTKIYVRDPQKGDITFTIKDKNTIVCEMKIIGDVYRRAAVGGDEALEAQWKVIDARWKTIMTIFRDNKDDCASMLNGVTEYKDKHEDTRRALKALPENEKAKLQEMLYQTMEKDKTFLEEVRRRCPGVFAAMMAIK